MKTRAIILAGGAGTRLGVLTAKRTKPAITFGGKYRIIDFPLSNCVNSDLFDVTIIAQYRPHSLIEHIGAGGPWDLNRDFTGGVRIYTPYTAATSDWFEGTADAVQQNFGFIKRSNPDMVLILSGDHIYTMDYTKLIQFHLDNHADLTITTINVSNEDASRFGIVGTDKESRVISFIEKPEIPPSTTANVGVYLFNLKVLDQVLWADHLRHDSNHDFGKDILPEIINSDLKVYAYPFTGYWVDVGVVYSYWKAHMDLLEQNPPLNLYDRSWIIHTRTEERPPVKILPGAIIENSLICDGCIVEKDAKIERSVLSPGVVVHSGAKIIKSIVLTDAIIHNNAIIDHAIIDKRVSVGKNAKVGSAQTKPVKFAMIGKAASIPQDVIIAPGAMVGPDVNEYDFTSKILEAGNYLQTKRSPREI